ncbi:hypothetical protein COL01_11480 [Bacillus thuringiensis]|uniref:Transport permease protein n=1 Tax=Bacillus thuringiensis TaxID=1428 RepID=A0A9X6WR06_BACTU|nr:ABC transporter permease [Bacillus thuringiensis]PFJ42573.1 hypothetical protein COJ15_05945 [Bacillus thuringiensis]PFN60566.1 hypothetical protein COJ75_11100 [Bacillus thuringiensis]PFV34470.1 hypothetical protein COL01_11480 [Bacillus thuringiensis]
MKKIARLSFWNYKALNFYGNKYRFIALKFITPYLQSLLFIMIGKFALGDDSTEFIALGNVVYILCYTTILGIIAAVSRDREIGILSLIYLSPIGSYKFLLSRSFVFIIDGIVTSTVSLVFFTFLFNITISFQQFIFTVLALIFTAVSLACLGLFLGSLSLIFKNAETLSNVTILLFSFICGVNFPVEKLPLLLWNISEMLPLTHGIDAVRLIFLGESIEVLGLKLLGVLFCGVPYFLLSVILFKRIESSARKKSTLDLM